MKTTPAPDNFLVLYYLTRFPGKNLIKIDMNVEIVSGYGGKKVRFGEGSDKNINPGFLPLIYKIMNIKGIRYSIVEGNSIQLKKASGYKWKGIIDEFLTVICRHYGCGVADFRYFAGFVANCLPVESDNGVLSKKSKKRNNK